MKKFYLLIIILAFCARAFAQTTLYVDRAATGLHDGTSWQTAYRFLSDALGYATAHPNDSFQILVAKGTYYPTAFQNHSNRDAAYFFSRGGIKLYGGFPSGGGTFAERIPPTATGGTILSGDIYDGIGINDSTDNSYHVMVIAGLPASADSIVVDGFTITQANADGTNQSWYFNGQVIRKDFGGAVVLRGNAANKISFRNNLFTQNNTARGGAGMYNYGSSPNVSNCTFMGNTTGDVFNNRGVGMYNYGSSPTVSNCTFTGNRGGGMYNYGSSTVIRNCTFAGNVDGAAIMNEVSSSPITIMNTIIFGNSYGIVDYSGNTVITYSLVQDMSTGTGNINGNTNPLFVNPQPFSAAPTTAGNYRLQRCSPAINVGNNSAVPTGITTDRDGNPRIFEATVDMGAYEIQTNKVTVSPKIIYVDSANGNDVNAGTSWGTALKNLSYALNLAHSTCFPNVDSILVSRGTYYPTGFQTGTDRDSAFLITRGGLKIYGGYPTGGGTRNVAANPTVLSGDINAPGSNTDNSYHVMVIAGLAAAADSVVVDGVTLTAGNANGSSTFTYGTTFIDRSGGAGVQVVSNNGNTRIAFRNCTISGNAAPLGSGAMYISGSAPTVANCAFLVNTAYVGGAMFNASSPSTIRNCTFSGNTGYDGGAMYNFTSSPTITNCVFSGNAAVGGSGGGVYNYYSSTLFLTNCTFSGNTATDGGGMYNASSNPVINNTIIAGNSSGISNSSSTPVISYSLVQGITTGTGNINGNTNPLFVNPQPAAAAPTTAGDYGLQACSPVINMGSSSAIPTGITTDLAGNPRMFGATVDMGAYEYTPNLNTGGLPTMNSIVTNIQSTAGATIYADNCNNMLATVTGTNTASSIGGSTTVKVWIDGTQNPQFVKRHYEIMPASNTATAAGAVTLYFTQAEFNAFNNANPNLQLPQNLLIEKRSGTSSDGSGHLNTYPGAPTNITPSSVVWNATTSRWEVSFFTLGFSGFWVKTQSVPLPVRLSSFTGTAQNCTTTLSWKTATETNFSHFDIERSSDGIVYQAIGKQSAKGSNSSYSFTDNTSIEGQVMYRLKIVDHDGAANYSSIVKLNTDCHYRAITVSPNPATDQVVVHGLNEGDRLSIYDAQGRLVLAERVKNRSQVMSIGNLAAGFYIIKVSDAQNGTVANIKLVKE